MGKEKINPLLNHFEVMFEKKYSQDREMINKKKTKISKIYLKILKDISYIYSVR